MIFYLISTVCNNLKKEWKVSMETTLSENLHLKQLVIRDVNFQALHKWYVTSNYHILSIYLFIFIIYSYI